MKRLDGARSWIPCAPSRRSYGARHRRSNASASIGICDRGGTSIVIGYRLRSPNGSSGRFKLGNSYSIPDQFRATNSTAGVSSSTSVRPRAMNSRVLKWLE
jgi:hypothetical protein